MAISLFKKRNQYKNKQNLFYSENHDHINDLIMFLNDKTNISVLLKAEGSEKKDNQGYFIMVDGEDFCKASIEGLKYATAQGYEDVVFFSKNGKKMQKIANVQIESMENIL